MIRRLFIIIPIYAIVSILLVSQTIFAREQLWQWQNPVPQGNHLFAIWSNADNQMVAAGSLGTFIVYDGLQWQEHHIETNQNIKAVRIFENHQVAVGDQGQIAHFFDNQWNVFSNISQFPLNALCGKKPGNIYAFGDAGTIVHFQNNSWVLEDSPVSANLMDAISFEETIFVVGTAGTLIKRNQQGWQPIASPKDADFTGIWGTSSQNIYVCGSYFNDSWQRESSVFHYDGQQWTEIGSFEPNEVICHIWGDSSNNLVAVSEQGSIYAFENQSWQKVYEGKYGLTRLHHTGTGFVAVGENGQIVRENNRQWIDISEGLRYSVNAIWGNSSQSYAICQNGIVLSLESNTWSVHSQPTTQHLHDISGNDQKVFIVGADGFIASLEDQIFQQDIVATTKDILGIHVMDNTAIAVGYRGTILHLENNFWDIKPSPTNRSLKDVWICRSDCAFAVGQSGTVLMYDGLVWESMERTVSDDLNAVWGSGPNNIFAAGKNGTIIHYDGNQWQTVNNFPSSDHLTSLWGSVENLYAVGNNGSLFMFHSDQWQMFSRPCTSDLNTVWGRSSTDIFIGGENGMILHYPYQTQKNLRLIIQNSIPENNGYLQGQVHVLPPPENQLTIDIQSSHPAYLTVPNTAIIPEGFTMVSFTCEVIDNALHDGVQLVHIKINAEDYASNTETITITDNESDRGVWVVSHFPQGKTLAPIDSIDIQFNTEIEYQSFNSQDITITGPNGPFDIQPDPTWITPQTARFKFNTIESIGTYTITVGPDILGEDETGMDQDGDEIFLETPDDVYVGYIHLEDRTGPYIVDRSPEERTKDPVTELVVTFNEPIDISTVEIHDIEILRNDGLSTAIASVNIIAPNQLVIYPENQIDSGSFHLYVGPDIMDLSGNSMNQDKDPIAGEILDDRFDCLFTIDNEGPRVLFHSLFGSQNQAVHSFDLTFSETIGVNSFTKESISVIGPSGSVAVLDIEKMSMDAFRIFIAPQHTDGTFIVSLKPTIEDIAGNKMDQDQNGIGGEMTDIFEFSVDQFLPDLIVSDIAHAPEALPGASLEITWFVQNQGQGSTTKNWIDQVYLSKDNVLGDDYLVAEVTNNMSMDLDEKYFRSLSIKVPDVIETHHWIIVKTNPEASQDENNFDNNNTVSAYPFWNTLRAYPDLSVGDIHAPKTIFVGESTYLAFTIKNLGNGPTSAVFWMDSVFLSKDMVVDDQDIEIAVIRNKDFLGAGEKYDQEATFELSDDTLPDNYYLLIHADSGDQVEEFDQEINNVSTEIIPVAVKQPSPGELVITSFESPRETSPGDHIQLTWTVQNVGQSTISSTSHMILLSQNTLLELDKDAILLWTSAGNYYPGQSYTLTHTVMMPSLIEMGAYYLIPATNRSVSMESEFNVPITITVSAFPDLVVLDDITFPEIVKTDQLMTISWQVQNLGQGKTLIANWLDYVYLSSDRNADPSDIYLGSIRHDQVIPAENGQVTQSKTFKVPEYLHGKYFVGIHTDALQAVNENNEINNFIFCQTPLTVQQLETDLAVNSASAPYSAITGQVSNFQWRIQNTGLDKNITNTWVDHVYLSSDRKLDDPDVLLGSKPHNTHLAGAQFEDITFSATIPPLMDGHYYVIIQIDADHNIYEANAEDNNIFVIDEPVRINHLFPDLQPSSCQVIMNAGVYAGESINITYTVINTGKTGTYGQWLDRFYLSTDNDLNLETDPLIGEITNTTHISAGSQIDIQSNELILPSKISGAYTIFVQVDALNQLYEYQGEYNNTRALPLTIQDSPSDLQVTEVNAPNSAIAGTAIHVSWKVKNMGRQETQESFWYDRVFFSQDEILNPAYDIEVGKILHRQPLKANETYSCAHYFEIQQDLGGLYYIFVQTDAENHVYENTKENNNIFQGQADILVEGIYVDLKPQNLTFNNQSFAGQSIEVTWQVKNFGINDTRVSSWEDIIYISEDSTLDTHDNAIALYQHNGVLNVNASYQKTKTIKIPKDIQGEYYLFVKTDANAYNDVYEHLAEDNNHIAKKLYVNAAQTSNLSVQSIDSPETAWSGQFVKIGWCVENSGAMTADTDIGFWYDSVYLSRDPFLDVVHDISIGNVIFDKGLLGASERYSNVLNTMLPPGISGPYYVIVQTDSSVPSHIFETNRMDNVRISETVINIQLTPPADLIVENLNMPLSGKTGELLSFIFKIKNIGELPAVGTWCDTIYLSTDQTWDIQDTRIARFFQNGDIQKGDTYLANITHELPAVIPGNYHVIVRTDILNDIRETNEQNNIFISPQTIHVKHAVLQRDTYISDQISKDGFRYFQLNVDQTEELQIVLKGPAAMCSQLFMSSDYIPSRSQYNYRGTIVDHDLLILNPGILSPGSYYILLYAETCPDQALFELSMDYLVRLQIHELSVSKATNIGMTTLQVLGSHFDPDIAAQLTLDHLPLNRVQSVNVLNSGTVSLTLDLNGLSEGTYEIVLENPDQETAQTSFEVINDKRGELFARLLIPGDVKQNEVYRFTLEYGNMGHSDILAPLLVISTGTGGLLRRDNTENFSTDPIQILGISDSYPVDILPPDSFYTIQFEFVLISDEYVPFYIQVMDQPDEPIDWDTLETKLQPDQVDDQLWSVLFTRFKSSMGSTWGDYVNYLRQNALGNALFGSPIYDVQDLLPGLSSSRTDIQINLPMPPGTKRSSGGAQAPEQDDVHDKFSAIGAGTLHHMLIDRTIEYTIHFENKSQAGASAQYIQVSDPINDNLSIESFVLKEIALGSYRIEIPPGHSYYQTRMEMNASGQNVIVDIEAGIDYESRIALWTFTAIDPNTGELSEDPLNGFLPPNGSQSEGEGYVRFQIKPQDDIASGTVISNMATIIFDRNEPVDTPIAYNTIDLSLPESKVRAKYDPKQTYIEVSWGGQDTNNGSGVDTYDVYVSENGQPYAVWLFQTTATSGIFIGQPDHEYAFYSIATDKVGNMENAPAEADVVVKLENTAPIANAGEDQTVNKGTMVTLDASLSIDTALGIVSYEWKQVHGPSVTLANSSAITTWFMAIDTLEPTTLSFSLSVTDIGGLSDTDVCNVIVVNNEPPEQPTLISPVNQVTDLLSTPMLTTSQFSDPDNSSHWKTQWQICETDDFTKCVMDINSSIFLEDLVVPSSLLTEQQEYYWRARHFDSYQSASLWSSPSSFSTSEFYYTQTITDESLDLDMNHYPDINQADMALIQINGGNDYIGIQSETPGVTIVTVNPIDPEVIPSIGDCPTEMPFGLISFRAICEESAEIDVNIYFLTELPSNAKWFKFDYDNGFVDYSDHTSAQLPGHKITIRVKDGGFGDADGIANGVIVDPGGIGLSDTNNSGVDAASDSGGCFIECVSFWDDGLWIFGLIKTFFEF